MLQKYRGLGKWIRMSWLAERSKRKGNDYVLRYIENLNVIAYYIEISIVIVELS